MEVEEQNDFFYRTVNGQRIHVSNFIRAKLLEEFGLELSKKNYLWYLNFFCNEIEGMEKVKLFECQNNMIDNNSYNEFAYFVLGIKTFKKFIGYRRQD